MKKSLIDPKSLKDVKRAVQNLADVYPKQVSRGMRRVGERIMSVSKKEWCVVRTGAMRNGGYVEQTTLKPLHVELIYPAVYAWEQHENMFLKHKIGRPKFLEMPIKLALPTFAADIAAMCPINKAVL